jgi:DnaJ homolog subfamily C member 1
LEADGEQTPINFNAATPPSLRSTWFISLVTSLAGKILEGETQPSAATQVADSDDSETGKGTGPDVPEPGNADQEQNRSAGKIGPAALKAGGRRRKTGKR